MPDAAETAGRVAVTGMAGRFPGAGDVDAFWRNLAEGRETISFFSGEEAQDSGGGAAGGGQAYVPAKGVLEDADRFDAAFFGFSPREAEVMDPQHRVFLECAWHALESAGHDPRTFEGRIGVFAGASLNSYLLFHVLGNRRVYASTGSYQTLLASDKDFLATRAAYKLGLTGPGVTVQTACSTSLTAVHLACQSLLNGECDVALAGGVSVSVPLRGGYHYEPGGILSPDGHCRAFDADAGGTVAGNGVGVVVLRRLADATEDGDTVDAVIRGTAVNNDGSLKAGYTAPSVDGQAEAIAEALAVAEVDPDTIGYVEAHGTGTALGDPIEVAALTRAYREHTDRTGYCALGSVKSNVGHLDAAAGVTALIKTVLALRHEALPATLHHRRANPALELDSSPFTVNTALRPWPRRAGAPRRAGVSSFGIGGTNVHLVLEEGPEPPAAPPEDPEGTAGHARVLPLSARTPEALAAQAERLAAHLTDHPGERLADVAHTLAVRRAALEHRTAVVCRDRAEAAGRLRRVRPADAVAARDGEAPVALLFPGQGAQYPGMARDLHAHEPEFAAALEECARLFAAETGEDLLPLLLLAEPEDGPGAAGEAAGAAARLARTELTQPALFAVEYALARLFAARGVRPRALAGHSIGELVAATVAGVFSLEDAVRVVAARGRLVQRQPGGAMLAVFLPEEETAARLGPGLCLAAVNSTGLTVAAGTEEAVAALEQRLREEGVGRRRLHTSHAFHSPDMDGAVEPFTALLRDVPLHAPEIPFLSNVTGTWITPEQATDPAYWGRQLRETVRFSAALGELLADPGLVLLECGPGTTLGDFARGHRSWEPGRTALGALPHPRDRRDAHAHLLGCLGGLWSAGVPVDWRTLSGDAPHRVLRLPGYPFERQRYWVEPDDPSRTAAGAAAGTGSAAESGTDALARALESTAPPGEMFHTPGWRRLPPRPATDDGGRTPDPVWLLLGADLPLGAALAAHLTDAGATVLRASAGPGRARREGDAWTLGPADREGLAELLRAARAAARDAGAGDAARTGGAGDAGGGGTDRGPAVRVVHLWSLTGAPAPDGAPPDQDRLAAARARGFDSLLALAQALDETRGAEPVEVDVVCRGVRAVTGEEPLQPENATLLGPCTVLPQEVPGTACRTLDLTGTDPGAPDAAAVHALADLLTGPPAAERDLALRGRHWWAREFDPVRPGTAASGRAPLLRADGVYLVTGGLGGVGLALAGQLADQLAAGGAAPASGGPGKPVLGLLGRSPFPPPEEWAARLETDDAGDPVAVRIRALLRLEERGVRVVPLQADVTDPEATARAVARLRAHGPLRGVVHAAGAPSTGLMAGKTRADADAVLAAKTRGTLVLEEVCREDPLDFLLLCSSLTSVLGGPGQSDYCAANAFLDLYAQARRDAGAPVTALAWDTWQDTGMAAGLAARLAGGPGTAPEAGTGPDGGPAPAEEPHPLLHRLVRRTGTARTYATVLGTDTSWIVDEHRIMGHGLVPGTTYLELVRAAAAAHAGPGRETELRDVLFLMPVIVPDGQTREVFTTVETRGEELEFTVSSRAPEGGWQDHATGTVVLHAPAPAVVRDLAEIERASGDEVLETEEEIHRRLKLDRAAQGGPMTFSFGPRWRCLRRIRAGERRLLVTLELDPDHAGDVEEYVLHPALLDVAGASARIHARDVYYLPFTYRSLRVHGPLTRILHCAVELKEPEGGDREATGETLTCDVELLDPDGLVRARITDFTIKRINDVAGLLEQVERAAAGPGAGTPDAGDPASGDPAAPGGGLLHALGAGMSPEQGTAAFARLLRSPDAGALPAQLVVTGRDLTALRRLARDVTPELLAREAEEFAPPAGTHPRPDLDTPYAEPATEEERAVAGIWQEVLGLDRVGVHDDFFALGGHSLAAVRIGTKIQSRFGTELDLRGFFDAPTVAGTVAALATAAERGPAGAEDAIEVLSREEPAEESGVATGGVVPDGAPGGEAPRRPARSPAGATASGAAPDGARPDGGTPDLAGGSAGPGEPGDLPGPDPDALDGLSDEDVDAQLRALLGEEGTA
ncbi:type I polyketide synthase [Streptomyces sp. JJ36]|uniref:type I polyketide synthase n=1 Tax=Streptomyces sp. JJ36 TaxID=2736645 RepID=UPI001F2CC141|nr:type I polyketide synthase [Streptomyces sp. JJ36]MCF6524681.1 acyltransferase domain-containing protein [Streptomyces sp. JJ36]